MKAKTLMFLLLATPLALLAHDPSKADKKSNNFDKRFISMMVPHHKDGIEIFSRCEQVATHNELKQLCTKMRSDQEKESSQMTDWYKSWFNADVPEKMSMKPGMKAKMDKLKTLHGADFEKLFLPTTAQHHQQAIQMAIPCPTKAQHPELKQMCADTKQKQTEEKKQLLQWNSEWYGKKSAEHSH